MKRVFTILATLALLFAAMPAATVQATGNCSTGYVRLWQSLNQQGTSRTFCYGVPDTNIAIEPGNNMGPLNDGSYLPDWDSVSNMSGLSSYYFHDNTADSTNIHVCIYAFPGYDGVISSRETSGYTAISSTWDNAAQSIYITTLPFGDCP